MSHGIFASPAAREDSLTEQVMRAVRAAIIENRMVPGELYSVYKLAEELGISRSPVRDGLLRLEEAGLIRFERNRGFRVIQTTPRDVAEIFAIRLALEVPAAGRAARLIEAKTRALLEEAVALSRAAAAAGDEAAFFDHDQEIHDILLRAAGNRRAREQVLRLRVSTRLLGASTAGDARSLADIVAEHEPVIGAVLAGDAAAAAAGMRAHLEHTGRLLVAQAARGQDAGVDAEAIWREMTAE